MLIFATVLSYYNKFQKKKKTTRIRQSGASNCFKSSILRKFITRKSYNKERNVMCKKKKYIK